MAGKAEPWFRLDLNFYSDPKVRGLAKRHGEAYVTRWLKLVCLSYREHGRLHLHDEMIRDWVEHETGLKGKRLDDTVDACASVGLFDAEVWREFGIVTSGRISVEAETIHSRTAKAKQAAKARWSKDADADADAEDTSA